MVQGLPKPKVVAGSYTTIWAALQDNPNTSLFVQLLASIRVNQNNRNKQGDLLYLALGLNQATTPYTVFAITDYVSGECVCPIH